MKKRISTILAIVLTIAVLASSFVMFGVHAEDPATETLTIGMTDYEIYTDKKFAAIDSINEAVSGLTPADNNAGYKNGPVVDFSGKAWSFESAGLWSSDLKAPVYITTQADYNQLCFYPSEPAFARKSIVVNGGKLYVNAAHGWQSVDDQQIKPIYFRFTATEDGNVVIYDTQGAVSSPAKNTTPFWAWIGNADDGGEWATFTIYKNNTILWPKNGQDNKIEVGGESIEFPDLGAIKVKAGDIISVEVAAYGDRTGIFINPAVAYAKVEENDDSDEPVETEDIVLNGTTYTIEKKSKYNAFDTLKASVSELDVTQYPAVDFSRSVWKVKTSRWKNAYDSNNYYGPAPYSGNPAILVGNSAGHWATSQNATSVVFDANECLAVSPFVQNDKTATGFIDLEFKAPKNGKVLIYDVLGAVKAPATNDASPYWAWLKNHNNKVEVTVLKNGTKIWPTDASTDNFITDVGDSVAIPDLGAIEVVKGETITVRIAEANSGSTEKLPSRDVVYTDIEVAYIYDPNASTGGEEQDDPNKETITVGTKDYVVLKDAKYDLYNGFTALTSELNLNSEVKFKGNWSMSYKYTKDIDFGLNPWKAELKYKYGIPYYSVASKGTGDVTYKGIYPDNTLSVNTWHNCFFLSATTLIPEEECVYISPAADALAENKIPVEDHATALKITFKSNKTGKAVIYDTTGIFNGDVARAPFWANESDKATVRVEIHKNGKKIWPTDGDVVISNTNKLVAFPDLGELDVKAGDKFDFIFYGNPEASGARAGVLCNPAIAFTEVTATVAQTDADFGAEVMVLVSVIVALGAVALTAGIISKKRAHN